MRFASDSVAKDVDGYKISVTPLCAEVVSQLQRDWLNLESCADNSFFVSWAWVSAWITTLATDVYVVSARYNDVLVGLGTLQYGCQKRHRVCQVKSVHLNHCGSIEKDQIWPEFNGFIVARGYEAPVYRAVLKHLKSYSWEELYSGVVTNSTGDRFKYAEVGLWYRVVWHSKGFRVDLSRLADNGSDSYLASLSRNTRGQIRRTRKKLETAGKLERSQARTMQEAVEMLSVIGDLHKDKWGCQSGFNNPHFVTFHEYLVRTSFDKGLIDITVLKFNGEIVAGLYNFIYKNTVYFYLSGIKHFDDNQLNIGLLIHALAIQQCAEDQRGSYDFMGGDMRYKRSLANDSYDLEIVVLEKASLFFCVEHMARRVKHWLLGK